MLPKLPKYKYLITYRLAEIIFDLVDAFVLRHLSHLGDLSYLSLKDQMLKCARSIKQNIIEAVSEIASLKSQIKLLGVAYGSVEELIADFEDFLRRKNLKIYPKDHPKIIQYRTQGARLSHLSNLSNLGHLKEKPALPASSEEAANLIITFCHQLSYLLKRQVESTEAKFISEGGYSENLFHKRLASRISPKSPKLPKLPKKPISLNSFTLMEILIVISLIILIAIIGLMTLNPKKQIEKSQDAKRKTELAQLQKTLEDWYNDKNCYPKPSQICYDSPVGNTCHICGTNPNSPDFSPYLKELPCDPQHPVKKYLYQVDDLDCPKNYWIYAKFSNEDDPLIAQSNCSSGCGPENDCNYNIGFTSPNASVNICQTSTPSSTPIPTNTPYPTQQTNYYCRNYNSLYIINNTGICNICGNYQKCLRKYPNKTFFIDSVCSQSCIKN